MFHDHSLLSSSLIPFANSLGYKTTSTNTICTPSTIPSSPVTTRITIKTSTLSKLPLQKLAQEYSILSIQVSDEKTFLESCKSEYIDVISINLDDRFYIKQSSLNICLQKNIFIEVCYGGYKDVTVCRNFLKVFGFFKKFDNLILSSGVADDLYLKSPFDLVNMLHLVGIDQKRGKEFLTRNCERMLNFATIRRNGFKGVVVGKRAATEDEIPVVSNKKQKI